MESKVKRKTQIPCLHAEVTVSNYDQTRATDLGWSLDPGVTIKGNSEYIVSLNLMLNGPKIITLIVKY